MALKMAHDSFLSEARLRGNHLAQEPSYYASKAHQNSRDMSLLNRRKPYIHEQRGFLPPFSIASILGIILFFAYIGSAVFSALPFGQQTVDSFSGVGALYTTAEEAAYCAAKQPEYDSCFSPTEPTNRTIYMQPYGGLGNRIRGVASALTIAKEVNANVVIVWTDKEHGFRGRWNELFASPKIPQGCFPGKAVREDHAKCTVHRINHFSDWEIMKNKFEIQGDKEVLCLQSMMFLTEKQRGVGWFYSLLRPAAPIADAIAAFQKSVNWDAWGQWVGVHIRRTDLRLLCNTDDCEDGLAATEVLPLEAYTSILDQVVRLGEISGDKPRFFLATDDPKTEEAVRATLKKHTHLRDDDGSIVSYSKAVRDAAADSLAMRSSLAGTAEAVVDLWLLSRARMLVGTEGSTYSQTAKLLGKNFFMSVGVEYENRL